MAHTNTLTLTTNQDEAILLYGPRDQYLKLIRDALGAKVIARGDNILIEGNPQQLQQAERVLQELRHVLQHQGSLTPEDVRTVLAVVQQGGDRAGPTNLTIV